MAGSKPLWRKAFDPAERAVGSRLERLVQTDQFLDVAALLTRTQNGAQGWVERRTRQVWHLVNLPAGSDIRRLREQLVGLDRQLRHVTAELEALRSEAPDAAAGPVSRRRGTTSTPRSRARRSPGA